LQQLQDIVQQVGSSLNAIHAAAALNTAARLTRERTAAPNPAADGSALQDGSISSSSSSAAEQSAAAATEELLSVLLPRWLDVLPQARPRELASVLYSSAKLHCMHEQLWSGTVAAFLQPTCIQRANAQDLSTMAYALATAAADMQQSAAAEAAAVHEETGTGITSSSSSSSSRGVSAVPGLAPEQVQLALQVLSLQLAVLLSKPEAVAPDVCQSIVKVLWVHAKLGCAMGHQELLLSLQTIASEPLLQAADAQALANTLWAVSEVLQLPTWQQQQQQAAVEALQQVFMQLLSPVQLRKIARGNPQSVALVLLALGRLAAGGPEQQHVLAVPFAQGCAKQLLEGPTAQRLASWNARVSR
jgi:hypothetical protein